MKAARGLSRRIALGRAGGALVAGAGVAAGVPQTVSTGGRGHTPRRAVLAAAAGGGALLAGSAMLGAAETISVLDAELISLCAEIEALQDAVDGIYFAGGAPSFDEEGPRLTAIVPLRQRQNEAITRLCELGTHTRTGILARARALAAWSPELISLPPEGFSDRMLAALLRDAISGDVR